MDSQRFDAFAQALAKASSRRMAMRHLVGLLAGANLIRSSPSTVRGRRKHRPRCDSGLTRCRAGKPRPGRQKRPCVDLQSDTDHCGACGNACPSAAACKAGQCQSSSGNLPSTPPPGPGAGSELPCGPENCIGCCNGTTCIPARAQSNRNCGLDGVTCVDCPLAFVCRDGNCVCLGPGESCDPTVSPDQCCAPESIVCSNGGGQPPGVCCLPEGFPCLSTSGTFCVPGSGCCCSGVCGEGNTCASSDSTLLAAPAQT